MQSTALEIGRRVAEARGRAGLTQQALGEVLGGDKTTISKVESGRRRLDGFELALIAERLETSVRELLGVPGGKVSLAAAARLGTSGARTNPVVKRAKQILELDALADELELADSASPRRPITVPTSGPGKARGVAAARELRSALGLGDAGIADLIGVCERDCGIDVAVEPLGSGPSGMLVHVDDAIALTVLNADDIAARQRFTLAHELGHHLFADAEVIVEDGDDVGTDVPTERRADWFAVEFLLPEAGVRRTVGDSPVTVRTVVDGMVRFGASREAYLNRLVGLGLLTSSARAQLELDGVRTLFATAGRAAEYEAWVNGTHRRAPARIEGRLLDGYRAGRIGIAPLAQLVGKDEDDLLDELADAGVTPDFGELRTAYDTI